MFKGMWLIGFECGREQITNDRKSLGLDNKHAVRHQQRNNRF